MVKRVYRALGTAEVEEDKRKNRNQAELLIVTFALLVCAITILLRSFLMACYHDAKNTDYEKPVTHDCIYDREMESVNSYLTKEQRKAIEEGRFDDL